MHPGLAVLAFAHSLTTLWLAWLILGVGMGVGLYDTAFAALGRIYGLEARSAITGITLLAGFASTAGWPLTAWVANELGWRETCLAWAGAHIVIAKRCATHVFPCIGDIRHSPAEGAHAAGLQLQL